MTRRIKWNSDESDEESDSEDEGQYASKPLRKGNFCDLVWTGKVKLKEICFPSRSRSLSLSSILYCNHLSKSSCVNIFLSLSLVHLFSCDLKAPEAQLQRI